MVIGFIGSMKNREHRLSEEVDSQWLARLAAAMPNCYHAKAFSKEGERIRVGSNPRLDCTRVHEVHKSVEGA